MLYLLVIAAGIISQVFISGKIIVDGDAAATAANMVNYKLLYQLGFTIYLIEMASQIAMLVLMYVLLRPVSRSVSLLALSFGLVGCVIKTLSRLFYIVPLFILGDASYSGVFRVEQVQALAVLLLDVNDRDAGMDDPNFSSHYPSCWLSLLLLDARDKSKNSLCSMHCEKDELLPVTLPLNLRV